MFKVNDRVLINVNWLPMNTVGIVTYVMTNVYTARVKIKSSEFWFSGKELTLVYYDKFSHHKKRVEERHLCKRTEPVLSA